MAYSLQLRKLRKEKKLTQGALAKLLGVSERTIGGWERDEYDIPLPDAWKCAEILGCTLNDLSGWYQDHPREPRPSANGMTPDESRTLAKYRALTISAQQAANAMLDGLGAQSKASAEGSTAYKEAAQG